MKWIHHAGEENDPLKLAETAVCQACGNALRLTPDLVPVQFQYVLCHAVSRKYTEMHLPQKHDAQAEKLNFKLFISFAVMYMALKIELRWPSWMASG